MQTVTKATALFMIVIVIVNLIELQMCTWLDPFEPNEIVSYASRLKNEKERK